MRPSICDAGRWCTGPFVMQVAGAVRLRHLVRGDTEPAGGPIRGDISRQMNCEGEAARMSSK